jgi:hypothetical protein
MQVHCETKKTSSSTSWKKQSSSSSISKTVRGIFQRKERSQNPFVASLPCYEGTTGTSTTTDQSIRRGFRRRNSGHKTGSSYEIAESETVEIYPKVRTPSSSLSSSCKSASLKIKIPDSVHNNDLIPPLVLPVGSSSSSSEHTLFMEANTPLHSNKTINFHSLSLGTDSQADTNSISKMEEPPQETYFSMTDFAKHNWVETIMSKSSTTESLSSLGFLSIMAATVVIHPMLFVTGAATAVWAVGVVHAVEKGYEFFTDGQFQNIFWADAVEEAPAAVEIHGGDDHDFDSVDFGNGQSYICPQHLQQPPQQQIPCPSPTMTRSMDDSLLPPSPYSTLPPSPPPPTTPHNSSQHRHPTSQDPSILAHFPPLENQLVTAEFPGLNALEFFHVFFSDHAPYSWKEFQQSMGDVDIEFGTWNKVDHPHPSTTFHPHVQLESLPHNPLPSCSQKDRVLSFKTLTKSYFGPAYASARKTQRVTKFSTRLVILENKTELFDIPFSDRFFVLERWIIESTKHDSNFHPSSNNATMKYTTRISVSVQVFMLKPCNWEKQIRSKTLSTMTDLVTTWSEKATQALDLTLRRKLERMRVRYDTNGGKSLYSFQSQTQDAKFIKSPSSGSVSTRTPSSLSSLSNNIIGNSRGGNIKKQCLETSEEKLMRIHERQLKLLEEKIASGDLEWCSIEMKHCLSAGEGRAFAKVLDQDRITLSTSSSPKNDNNHLRKNQDVKKKSPKVGSSGKKSDKISKWNFNNGVKGGLFSDNKRLITTGEKGHDSAKKRLILRRKKDTLTE